MFCKLNSYSLNGLSALPIDVEIDMNEGLPGFDIVGLPDSSVRESKERVKSAIKNCGYRFPIGKITVNLAPADLKKEGSLYDLPIALGILACMGQIDYCSLNKHCFIGELALDGSLRGIRGLLPILCEIKQQTSRLTCIIPSQNADEASLIQNYPIYHAAHLNQIIAYLKQQAPLSPCTMASLKFSSDSTPIDYKDVKGQESAKRGFMIAAGGRHNLLLIGPPGSGKTMLAQRLVTILPPLSQEESIEVTKIYSIAHMLPEAKLIKKRPFRTPHHTISPIGLTGGGLSPKPGEISLAHLGVLFLDELLEFNRRSLEILRQPLETHSITLSRAQHSFTYPAHFLFIASTNPCPCGYYPDVRCSCSIPTIKKYLSKLSGPLLDRIDLQIETHAPKLDDLYESHSLSSQEMYKKVEIAQKRQEKRFKNTPIHFNSEIPSQSISTYCHLTSDAEQMLKNWFKHANSSMRTYDRILRLALTLSDFSESNTIESKHIAEALQYRLLDHHFWN